ncbi:hypothetical protein AB0P37_08640 [Streptomyces antimycoticus]|uniref:hypothetical protein n=1 Tax=Streptomyces antimycoticus TaxID=68175 RepID=UPI00343F7038
MKASDYGLSGRGGDLFDVLTATFDFDAHELPTVVELCLTASLLERLESAMSSEDLIVMGSQRQPTANPILGELARHRGMYVRLYSALNLPELDEGGNHIDLTNPRSVRAQKAAQARWGKVSGG